MKSICVKKYRYIGYLGVQSFLVSSQWKSDTNDEFCIDSYLILVHSSILKFQNAVERNQSCHMWYVNCIMTHSLQMNKNHMAFDLQRFKESGGNFLSPENV